MSALTTDVVGRSLTSAEVAASRARRGRNEVRSRPRSRFRSQVSTSFVSPMVLMLLAVGGLYALLGAPRDTAVILAVVVAVVGVELGTRWRTSRSVASLAHLSAARAMVWRDRELTELPPQELVVDDVILLGPGSRVPADAWLLESDSVLVDESLVTGEPQPVEHGSGPGEDGWIRAGTSVVRGRGVALVTAVGDTSTLGRVAEMIGPDEARPSPLREQMAGLARELVGVALPLCAVVALLGALRGQPLRDAVLRGLTLAFATVPLELPVLVVVILGLGSLVLARRGAVVRHLGATETLGAVSAVCTDKTGTLTQNRIVLQTVTSAATVIEDAPGGRESEMRVKQLAMLASEPPISEGSRLADPIDAAVWRSGEWTWPDPVLRFGFDTTRRLSSALTEVDGKLVLGVKGAPEAVIVRTTYWRRGPEACFLESGQRDHVMDVARSLAAGGARVLMVASREVDGPLPGRPSAFESGLVLEGVLAFGDSLRPGTREAVHDLLGAGVAVTMVTGDQPATAEAAARSAGLAGRLFLAAQTRDWTERELAEQVTAGCVIARARPEDKLRAVRAAESAGAVVAATGDGVNDAPALAAAELGVAMGPSGSDVAREAADLVLADDSFGTLAGAIAEGRRIYENLRKAVRYYLAAKLGLIGVSLAVVVAGLPLVFTPVQIVVLALFMDLGAAFAFVNQPQESGEVRQRPRGPEARLLDASGLLAIASGAATLAAVTGAVFALALPRLGVGPARGLALAAWLVSSASLGMVMGWQRRPLTRRGLRQNPRMLAWAAAAFCTGLTVLAWPGLAGFLHTAPAPAPAAAATVAAAALAPLWLEAVKRLR